MRRKVSSDYSSLNQSQYQYPGRREVRFFFSCEMDRDARRKFWKLKPLKETNLGSAQALTPKSTIVLLYLISAPRWLRNHGIPQG